MKKAFLFILLFACAHLIHAQVWTPINSGTTLKLNSVSFGSDLVGYIGANDSTLLKSFDGGLTWVVQPTNGLFFSSQTPDIIQVDFVDENVGFAMVGQAQYVGYMFKTVDGGLNWTPEGVSMCTPIFSYNFDGDNSYAVGASCFGGKTIDKKVNGLWQSNTTYLSWGNEYLRTIDFYDTLYGITAGDSGMVHRTFNGGLSWDTVQTFTDEIIWDLEIVNDSLIFGVVDSLQNTLMFSTDSGATWAEHMNSLTFFFPRLKALSSNTTEMVIAVGESSQLELGVILWGRNEGGFWNVEQVSNRLHDVTFINNSLAITVGDSGIVYRTSVSITGVNEVQTNTEIVLYPNPADLNFSIQGNERDILEVSIIDMAGREVKRFSTGMRYFDISSIKPGFYHVLIQIKNGLIAKPLVITR